MADALPNILWIGTDEQQRSTIGAYGSRNCRTPTLDALAADSLVFDAAFCPMAVCAPARASMLSGRLPGEGSVISNDLLDFTHPDRELGPRRPLESWAPALRQAGYELVHVGKWHASGDGRPSEYGFAGPDWPGYGIVDKDADYHAYRQSIGLSAQPEYDQPLPPNHPFGCPFDPVAARLTGPEAGSVPAFLTHLTTGYLDQLADRRRSTGNPFFLRCEFWGPHISCNVPEPYWSMYDPASIELPPSFGELEDHKPYVQRNFSGGWGIATYPHDVQRQFICRYYAYASCIDAYIARILQRLDELDLGRDTIVAFTSDHGDMLGAHGLYDKGPFMYEEIYRVPLMVRWPGVTPPRRSDALVYNMDLAPTLWDLAGQTPPAGGSARSLLPILKGQTDDVGRQVIVCEHYRQWDFYTQAMAHSGVDKFIYNFADTDEYYDLQTDPHEMNNRINDPAVWERVHVLRNALYEWMKQADSPMLHGFERTLVSKPPAWPSGDAQ